MITRYLGDCNKSYDFKPLKEWPLKLPLFSWDSELLCGFNVKSTSKNQNVINLKTGHTQLADLIAFIYPQLTLSELARLYSKLHTLFVIEDWDYFFSLYKLRFCDNLTSLLELLVQTPLSFQLWVSQKQVQTREINSLKCVSNIYDLTAFFHMFSELNPTRSQGIQILELFIELFEMKYPKNDLLELMKGSPDLVQTKLQELRHPISTEKKNNLENRLKHVFKVNGVDAHSKRFGDKSGVEIKFFSESNKDFQIRLSSLNKWYENFKDQEWI